MELANEMVIPVLTFEAAVAMSWLQPKARDNVVRGGPMLFRISSDSKIAFASVSYNI